MRPKHDTSQRYRRFELASEAHPPEADVATLDLRSIRRHKWSIFSIVLVFLMLAVAFGALRSTWYSASTRLFVDHRNPSLTVDHTVFMTSDLSGRLVDSQVEILRSQKVIAKALELLEPTDRELLLPKPSTISRILDRLGLKKISVFTDEQRQNIILSQIMSHTTVSRIGETFTIEILARSADPYLAVRLATAMTDAFLEDQATANASAARGASPWLLERLKNSGTTARVIANATVPLTPDGPNIKYVIIAFVFAGFVVGVGVAFTYDILDTKIRTPEQATDVSGAECLGMMNVLPKNIYLNHPSQKTRAKRWTANYPFPADAKSLNCCCIATTVERPDLQTLGVISCMPGEGKSTIAVNLARTIAASGQRVLLVDTARDNMDLSVQLTPGSAGQKDGVRGVLFGKSSLENSIVKEPSTGVHFLPYGSHGRDQNELSIWARHSLNLEKLTSKYDVVIFDLPAITADCSARAAAQLLDGMLLVIEYGKLPADTALKIMEQAGRTRNNILGVVLNKVKEADFRNYASLKPKYRHPTRPELKSKESVSASVEHSFTIDARKAVLELKRLLWTPLNHQFGKMYSQIRKFRPFRSGSKFKTQLSTYMPARFKKRKPHSLHLSLGRLLPILSR